MISVNPRAEKFREAVASGGIFRNAQVWSLLPARGTQRGNAGEFVFFAQSKHTKIESTDEHR